ncbi:MAG: GIY-YIG nuclease family protein [Deltaproteobacteria bacterium]|nr:GIY-YIG nuclease family protein [Deltaproteobacteria bacterium]
MSWFVYILRCSDGSYYTGHTEDPEARLRVHNSGKGPSYTAARRPVVLRYAESHPSKEAAVQRERRLKKWSRAKKQALINGDTATLKEMSKCRNPSAGRSK